MVEIPKEWKPAGSGEEEIAYTLYDMNASGTTASATVQFFNASEATDTKAVTNMEISGQLPSSQRFLVKSIQLLLDVEMAAGDSADILDSAVIEMYIQNKRVYCAPAALHVTSISPHGPTATANTAAAFQFTPPELDKGIVINGGTPFRVEVQVGKTAASASSDMHVILVGRLVRPA